MDQDSGKIGRCEKYSVMNEITETTESITSSVLGKKNSVNTIIVIALEQSI